MKIIYIGHSGYLVEFSGCCCLFDYYTGTLPRLSEEKPLFVFVSHHHPDHYNPVIYELAGRYKEVRYILPPDVKLRPGRIPLLSPEETEELRQKGAAGRFLRVKSGQAYTLEAGGIKLELETLRSTDCGVAYLVISPEGTVFHAGDLNWWAWEGESKQCNNNMEANYKREVDRLAGRAIHVAFLPIDPRQEGYYWLGFDYFLRKIRPEKAFPMHFSGDQGIISRFLEREHEPYQSWVFDPMESLEEEIAIPGERFLPVEEKEKAEVLALYRGMVGTPGCTWSEDYPAEEDFERDAANGHIYCMKAPDGKILGAISMDEDENTEALPDWDKSAEKPGELARLAVAKEYQNRGLARRMIRAVIKQMKRQGYDFARYLVSPGNPAALASYAPLQFRCVGRAALYGQDWLLYEKCLKEMGEHYE